MGFKEQVGEVKTTLESFLKPDMSKEQIDAIAKASQLLDDIAKGYEEQEGQLTTMRKDYIDMVKHTGFKPQSGDKGTGNAEEQPRTLNEIADEVIAKRK